MVSISPGATLLTNLKISQGFRLPEHEILDDLW